MMVKNNPEVKIWKCTKMSLFIGKIRKILKNESFKKIKIEANKIAQLHVNTTCFINKQPS